MYHIMRTYCIKENVSTVVLCVGECEVALVAMRGAAIS